jgi:hypothetical protein
MYGGRQVTAFCLYENKTVDYKKYLFSDRNLFYLLSFFKGNYIGIDEIEIREKQNFKRIFLNDKTYRYNENSIIDDEDDLSKIINNTYLHYQKKVTEIKSFNDLIEIYIECLRNTTLESQFAMVSVLFEGLKTRYINSKLITGQIKIIKKNKYKLVDKSFKEILIDIFLLERFNYNRQQLDDLIKLRNNIIHEASYTSKKYNFKEALKIYMSSLDLFVRFILHIIKYEGKYLRKTYKNTDWVKF